MYPPFIPKSLIRVINRGMNLDPKRRFATLTDFRHAIEQVPIAYNWRQTVVGDPEEWLGTATRNAPSTLYRVICSEKAGYVELSHCKTVPGKFRKITSDCLTSTNCAALRGHQKAVMARITAEGNSFLASAVLKRIPYSAPSVRRWHSLIA